MDCHEGGAGSYDCVVAYTDVSDPLNQVRFRRFKNFLHGSGDYYFPVFESGDQFITTSSYLHRTTSDIALWYKGGYWYVAYRPSSNVSSQFVRVYRSSSAATGTWSWVANAGYSITGPQAITDSESVNYLWTTKWLAQDYYP